RGWHAFAARAAHAKGPPQNGPRKHGTPPHFPFCRELLTAERPAGLEAGCALSLRGACARASPPRSRKTKETVMNRSMRLPLPGLCAASLAAWALLARPARADTIDECLPPKGAEIMEHLQKRGYKNVGVLHFRVE